MLRNYFWIPADLSAGPFRILKQGRLEMFERGHSASRQRLRDREVSMINKNSELT